MRKNKGKSKSKGRPKKEKRDFAPTAFSIFQTATGVKQFKEQRHSAQHHSRSGRGR
jgi:hypothetical protein